MKERVLTFQLIFSNKLFYYFLISDFKAKKKKKLA